MKFLVDLSLLKNWDENSVNEISKSWEKVVILNWQSFRSIGGIIGQLAELYVNWEKEINRHLMIDFSYSDSCCFLIEMYQKIKHLYTNLQKLFVFEMVLFNIEIASICKSFQST